ncbi:3-deoxy-8-phosphooctulonate synthase [Tranquillimonas alkanivorans]|uniref:2-dehydro-3-deoxyphosphooctonate aldolase n=1 Tax=Tranquillimonas alkanivorans TaxID=441119 RepID=A0A1I5L647_9RHOB|nr:3-deoxy-8-phosphooctulonate synthase [Tranquillimonas alkanivorans]SFO92770.1 2-dehydro-3-deoxyphosphooctonate aldolase (KDO 8-P synthase) [Tranquillimonas alkanivorans]
MNRVEIGGVTVANDLPLTLVSGPCQLESFEHAKMIAETLKGICDELGLGLVFKASFDKANRSSLSGKRGVGLQAGLDILARVRAEVGVPVLTDVHEAAQCAVAAEHVDILQIPAFLCRQTDLLLAAGETGAAINVKKGQFLAPWDMQNVVEKIESTGNRRILLTERGASFGYNMLVSDMRSLPIMARTGYPVVFDATHSVQLPGGQGTSSGGQAEFVPPLARAAVAAGCAAVFIETHEEPSRSPSDGPNMVRLDEMAGLLRTLAALDGVVKA